MKEYNLLPPFYQIMPFRKLSKKEKENAKIIERVLEHIYDEALRGRRILKTPWGVLTWTTKEKKKHMTATEAMMLKEK